jgi:hypothetical protein
MVLHHLRRLAPERRRPGEQLIKDHAEGVDVAAAIDVGPPLALLGGHVFGRARRRLFLRHVRARLGLARLADQSEVEQLGPEGRVHEHVLGFEIAVNQVVGVRGLDGAEQPERVGRELVELHRAGQLGEAIREDGRPNQLHH